MDRLILRDGRHEKRSKGAQCRGETGGNPRSTSIASVSAAVLVALYGLPAAEAQQQSQAQATTSDTLKEVVVTATHREQTASRCLTVCR